MTREGLCCFARCNTALQLILHSIMMSDHPPPKINSPERQPSPMKKSTRSSSRHRRPPSKSQDEGCDFASTFFEESRREKLVEPPHEDDHTQEETHNASSSEREGDPGDEVCPIMHRANEDRNRLPPIAEEGEDDDEELVSRMASASVGDPIFEAPRWWIEEQAVVTTTTTIVTTRMRSVLLFNAPSLHSTPTSTTTQREPRKARWV